MQRTRIDWADYSWNPVTGCRRGCAYCYARRMAQRLRGRYGYPLEDPFRPTFHPERLREPERVRKPGRLFVCSMAELFADGQDSWVGAILKVVEDCPRHQFLFLTKNPDQLARWNPWPMNAWVGITATDGDSLGIAFSHLDEIAACVRFISLEPLMGELGLPILGNDIQWVIVGAMTGPQAHLHSPKLEWIKDIAAATKGAGIPLWMKENLRQHFPSLILRQELPDVRQIGDFRAGLMGKVYIKKELRRLADD